MFAQTGCSISIHGDIKNVTGHSHEQPVPADPEEQRVGQGDLKRLLPTPAIL